MCERCKHHRVCRRNSCSFSPISITLSHSSPLEPCSVERMKGSQSVAASHGFKIRFKNVRESILLESSSSPILTTPRCWSFDPVRVTPSEPTLSMKPSILRRRNTSIAGVSSPSFWQIVASLPSRSFGIVRPRITDLEQTIGRRAEPSIH